MTRLAVLATAVVVALVPTLAGAQAPKKSAVSTAQDPAPSAAPSTTTDRRTQAKNDRTQPVTVDADKMERFGKEGLVVFTGNVVARQNGSVQYADRMEVYLDERGDKIQRTVSTGSIRIITRDCRTGTAQRAEYYDLDQRVVLLGNARVWQADNVVSGETITIFLSQDRATVQGGPRERVKGVFYQKDDNTKDTASTTQPTPTTVAARPAPTTCEN
jgi:lipopolysaccharide export system protein LptA